MNKKYKLIKSDIEDLFRIRALKKFGDVNKGDIGGYVESEDNLSHFGNCWIFDNAKVYENAMVSGDAYVSGYAQVSDCAQVYGNALVSEDARVSGNARIYGKAHVYGDAEVSGNAQVSGSAKINIADITGDNKVFGTAASFKDGQIVSDLTCLCANKKEVTSATMGASFKVCSKTLGGCGKEIV